MKKRITTTNIVFSLLLHLTVIAKGLIVPRIILGAFGSDINGLITSLTQFLNYLSLLEGGVSGVAIASLYAPLAQNDWEKVSGIYAAIDSFFRKIGIIYIAYAFGVAVVYPLVVKTEFSYDFVFTMTLILAFNLILQYFFSLSYRALLIADRRVYYVSLAEIIATVLNLVLVIMLERMGCGIRALKLISGFALLVQPIMYRIYAERHYRLDRSARPSEEALSQRWDGFGQNLAYYIHSNTDVIILTLFSTLANVSIYSVHIMVCNALRGLLEGIGNGFAPTLGNALVTRTEKEVNGMFDRYAFALALISTYLFTNAIILIQPFISVYTYGIHDAVYRQPLFAIILLLAESMYCFRGPYIGVVFNAGHFRQTKHIAYMEAGINLAISLILVRPFGLAGIGLGTLVSILYRTIAHVVYLKNNILHRQISKFMKSLFVFYGAGVACVFSYMFLLDRGASVETWRQWILTAIISGIYSGVFFTAAGVIFYRRETQEFLERLPFFRKS